MASLIWLFWFAWYLLSLGPSLGGEDSGEFATVAATLGISHPPGYPLYALLGRLFCLIPAGSIAFRLNLFSAAAAAGAVTFLWMVVFREARNRFGFGAKLALGCAAAASFTLGASQTFWYQAGISDKYPLQMLFFSAIMFFALKGNAWLQLACILGLSFSHHMQTLYVVPGLIWLALKFRTLNKRHVVLWIVLGALGLSLKLMYPPIRATQEPVLMLEKPVTSFRLLNYVRAQLYSGKMSGPINASRWKGAFSTLCAQLNTATVVVGLVGLLSWVFIAPVLAGMLWLTWLTGLALSASLTLADGPQFYTLPLVWLIALGIGSCPSWAVYCHRVRWNAYTPWIGRLSLAVIGVCPAWTVASNISWFQRNRLSLEYDHIRNVLTGLPPRAVFFANGDDYIYPSFYLQLVERYREDVLIIPEGFLGFYYEPMRERLRRSVPELAQVLRPAAILKSEDEWSHAAVRAFLKVGRPCGFNRPSRKAMYAGLEHGVRDAMLEIWGDGSPPRADHLRAHWLRTRSWYQFSESVTDRQRAIIGSQGAYQRQYADQLSNSGRVSEALPRFRRALSNPYLSDREGAINNFALALEKAGDLTGALAVYQKLIAARTSRSEVYLNAGNLLVKLNRKQEALSMFQTALELASPSSRYWSYANSQLQRLQSN